MRGVSIYIGLSTYICNTSSNCKAVQLYSCTTNSTCFSARLLSRVPWYCVVHSCTVLVLYSIRASAGPPWAAAAAPGACSWPALWPSESGRLEGHDFSCGPVLSSRVLANPTPSSCMDMETGACAGFGVVAWVVVNFETHSTKLLWPTSFLSCVWW